MRGPSGRGSGSSCCARLCGGSSLVFDGAECGDNGDINSLRVGERDERFDGRAKIRGERGQLSRAGNQESVMV